jgi:hypothetical protein
LTTTKKARPTQKKDNQKDPSPQQQPTDNNGNNDNGNKNAAAMPNKATGGGTSAMLLKLVHNPNQLATKKDKKEEPASHGSQLGPKQLCHTAAATGELIGQVILVSMGRARVEQFRVSA